VIFGALTTPDTRLWFHEYTLDLLKKGLQCPRFGGSPATKWPHLAVGLQTGTLPAFS
jgi:hypothetical protein